MTVFPKVQNKELLPTTATRGSYQKKSDLTSKKKETLVASIDVAESSHIRKNGEL